MEQIELAEEEFYRWGMQVAPQVDEQRPGHVELLDRHVRLFEYARVGQGPRIGIQKDNILIFVIKSEEVTEQIERIIADTGLFRQNGRCVNSDSHTCL